MYTRVVTLWLNVSPLLNLLRLQTCTDRHEILNSTGEFLVNYASTDMQTRSICKRKSLMSPVISQACRFIPAIEENPWLSAPHGKWMNHMLKLGLASPQSWDHILAILILFCGHKKVLKSVWIFHKYASAYLGKGSHLCSPNRTEGSHQYLQQQG